MRSTTMKILLPCVAVLLVLASAGNARATLAILVQEDGTTYDLISGSSPQNITGFSTPNFTIDSFTATSAETASQGNIQGVGSIDTGNSDGVTHVLTIIVSEDSFTNPSGPNFVLGSSSSYTAVPIVGANPDGYMFQSFATPGQSLFGMTVPSPGTLYAPIEASGSNNESPTPFTSTSGYTLTQVYTWTDTGPTVAILQPTGSTVATAGSSSLVPEPSSLVLFGLGSLGLLVVSRRRCA